MALSEFAIIDSVFRPLARRYPESLALEDDAALLVPPAGHNIVLTADCITEGVHFLSDDPPDTVARKLIRTNLSDIAAMGARPLGVMLTVALRRDLAEDWLHAFGFGLRKDMETYNLPLLGGDTTTTPGPSTFSLTALGKVLPDRVLRRAGARTGEDVWVSGTIGDAAMGLRIRRDPDTYAMIPETQRAMLVERYRVPQPRLDVGVGLRPIAGACIDVSDGLLADLGHICKASGRGATIRLDLLPLSGPVREAVTEGRVTWDDVVAGGDDYELLFTAGADVRAQVDGLARETGVPLTRIGSIGAASGGVVALQPDGAVWTPSRLGYEHEVI